MPLNLEKKIRVEIVTPVHNRKDLTLQCLRSIGRLDASGLDIHTVIVDDGSTDGTGDAIRSEFPDVEVITADGSLWFTEGTNVAIRAALEHDPKYVLLINDDQVFNAASVRLLVECAEANPGSVVGPLLLLWDMPHKLFQTAPVWSVLRGGWRHWFHQTVWTVPELPFEVELIVGNCVLVPAEAIRRHGSMDSKRYPNFGDAEYTPRLRKRGWRLLIEPRSRVFCQPNAQPAAVKRMPFSKKLAYLLIDTKQPQNLRRRFYSMMDGAPNKFSGLAAFVVFFFRIALGINAEGDWAARQEEIPLAERFRDKVVKQAAK